MSEPAGPDLTAYSSRPAKRPGPPAEDVERDPIDPQPRPKKGQDRNPEDVQFNTRIGKLYRDMFDELHAIHPRRRATIRDTLEDLIEEAHTAKKKQIEAHRRQRD